MKSFTSNSAEETGKMAIDWLNNIRSTRDKDKAVVVGLSGHLGSGKTTFVKAIADKLGIKDFVTSPTFVIMKIYDTPDTDFKKLIHIDAYRLPDNDDLSSLGLAELANDKSNLIIIEWPKHEDHKINIVNFEHKGGDSRAISY